MKIETLKIEGLYGEYSYYIKFNNDVTLIYGSNGCGKTTVLDIITNIITGEVYKLFNYNFKRIQLQYCYDYKNKSEEIVIEKYDRDLISMTFMEENIKIERRNNEKEEYFYEYPILRKINHIFNYVYLPLNRVKGLNNRRSLKHRYISDFDERVVRTRISLGESSMDYVEELIRTRFFQINSEIANISDEFRNNLLKSLLDIDIENRVENIRKREENLLNIQDIKQTKNAYIKILKDINEVNDELEAKYNKFFDDFIYEVNNDDYTSEDSKLLKFNEVIKIKDIVSMAKKMEDRKARLRQPIEVFLNTINEFISIANEDKKEIIINKDGRIYFTVRGKNNQHINIKYLSSGEKQLITFFANLIFGVNSQNSIFVVDEPELSLHLAWQKMFIPKTMEINRNIQLIFATHSPEIIGRYRDKMFKLRKIYNN
ncbi:AAA family ATPase [Clostridium perfringens]